MAVAECALAAGTEIRYYRGAEPATIDTDTDTATGVDGVTSPGSGGRGGR